MAINQQADLNFGGAAAIIRALMNPVASDPVSPVEGEVWYNSTDERLKWRANGVTRSVAHTGDTGSGVPASTWDAQSLVVAISDDTPIAQVVGASEVVGRRAAGDIGVITYAQLAADLETLIDAANLGGADPFARANHTGTQAHTTISDFDAGVQTNRLDQLAAPTADVDLNSQKITGLATGTLANDAVNKQQLDDAVAGVGWKVAARAATTGDITLTGTQTIDGVGVVADDRVLVKDQAAPAQNGVYVVQAGSWVRAADANTEAELRGMGIYVEEGTANEGTAWVLTTDAPIVVDTTALTYAQFGGGQLYTAGDGLTLTANEFDVGAGTGITVDATNVNIDTTVVVRKAAGNIGNGAATDITFNHGLGTTDITVEVFEIASGETIICEVDRTDANNVELRFNTAPTTDQYRVVVHG